LPHTPTRYATGSSLRNLLPCDLEDGIFEDLYFIDSNADNSFHENAQTLQRFPNQTIMSAITNSPTPEEVEDVLLSCRYGDLEDVQAFVEKFGDEPLKSARDDRGNNVIHMCCGNGHTGKSSNLLKK
jgi:hypothetical protein